MSKIFHLRSPFCAAVVGCITLTANGLCQAADNTAATATRPTASPSHVDTFARASGETFFAIALTPQFAAPAGPLVPSRPHDIVVLFDTSASQSGEFREKGLTALKSLLDSLADQDRVRLLAVDLAAVPMTETFVAVKSPAMTAGMVALRKRVPLGATDMAGALDAAVESLGERSERGAAVVYLGDGMSTAQLIASPRMQQLVNKFVARRASISSYAFGPRLDTVLLGILATHTGGGLILDQEDHGANQIGMHLAGLAAGEVVWPREVKLADTLGEVYPKQFPPLRTDRDSIVIGRADHLPAGEIAFTGELAGRVVRLSWTIAAPATNEDNAYLADLVTDAKKDGGLGLPLVSSTVLQQVGELVGLKTHALVRLAQQALATGSNENAERLANEALRLDASHPEALAVRHALQKIREGKGGARPLKLVNFQIPAENITPPVAQPGGVGLGGVGLGGDGDFLRRVQEENRVLADLMRVEVTNSVTRARSMLGTEPAAAIDLLKLALDKVSKAPELSADARTQLRNQIEASLMEASRRKVVKEESDLRQQQIEAERRARMQLVTDLQNRQEKLKQLMDRFENLMDERRYGDAADIAALARSEDPRAPSIAQGFRIANDVNAVTRARAIREASQLGMQSLLANIDISAVPFSDDPPVVYPDAEQWRLMTEKRAKYRNVDLASKKSDNEKQIIEALGKKVTLENLEQIPLKDVIDIIKAQQKIPMIFDTRALTDANIQEDTLVSINVKDVTLRSALRVLLRPHELTYIIKDEVLQITSKSAADDIAQNGVTKVYPVADLVVPIPQGGLSGFGGLGGSSGGIGGGGGGGGGMGGGGGGGGGGFGGGGGGFAVPPENLNDGPDFENALAFNDGLKLSGKKTAPAATVPVPAIPAAVNLPAAQPVAVSVPATSATPPAILSHGKIEAIQLEVAPGETIETAWDRHFAAREENPAMVRETVRRLMKARQFEPIVALIQATLRHDQSQPWMYEALGIAMQANGASPQDVERALMSAVDFRAKPSDLIHVAQYLLKALPGNPTIEQRALKLYQQVIAMEPTQPQAYVESLLLAQRLNDIEAVQWATAGILSQAWPKDQREIPALAERVAAATYELLKSQKRLAEAEAFKKAIDAALVRDCMIVVSWTGNADVDLLVEEPAGTVCSFRNPRTTSGGMMMGDSMASGDERTAGATSESYVCPQGFNGTYKMLLRRVWGKTTVDKVTVDYYVHRGTPGERHFRKQIALADGEAAVALELKNGRRTEPLEHEQVINAVAGQMAIGRAILAQQLTGLPDVSSATGGGSGSRFTGVFPVRGAVGYQPVIITLPTGVNMSAVAVVSADRRYVRVTAQPLFSQIPLVNTFNYQSGSSGTSNGSTGGGSTGAGT